MKFRGIIRNVGASATGISKTTGKEWTRRDLVIAVAYPQGAAHPQPLPRGGESGAVSPSPREGFRMGCGAESPSPREGFRMGFENLMVGSYFGEATQEQLLALADTAAPLEFTVFFDVHQHEQRYYQDIRIGSIKSIV